MNKHKKSWLPKKFLFRLTFLNIIIVSLFIVLSSLAIYNTACFLVEGMNGAKQKQFNSTLFYYLWIFSLIAILIGSIIHFYLTKKLIQPLKRLIETTKSMKRGNYPESLEVTSSDEIGQLISNFNELVNQLKDNHEHRKKLVMDLSHELRTPLSNLNGYLYALKNGVIEGDETLYHSLYKESERLTKMVTQIETLKEWDYISKQSFSDKEKIAVDLLIKESAKMFFWQLKDKNIPVEIHTERAEINMHKEGILQAISNLIDNAIRYYVGIGSITIKGEKLENEYYVSITGPSQEIPADNKDKMFERFYRIDGSRSRDTGGAGLGLSITKEIIEQHHGKIGYKPSEDKNTFWFTLPL
ncbi:sensor histidine kinase [Bacillus sp. SD088]|uniref:sensor histidine kinase n=1 Tax=Bacillus sp. SD088 TaxID=2782012 RepID=UPI001A97BB11|nr:ATP-binding protein [Bacillus sp. SD088]MBO0994369.1 HAMP domain-containing protein [Bacillus sp. SD088]